LEVLSCSFIAAIFVVEVSRCVGVTAKGVNCILFGKILTSPTIFDGIIRRVQSFLLLPLLVLFMRATFVRGDNVVIHSLVEFLHCVISNGPNKSGNIIFAAYVAHLEFNGSSELRTQLFMENCSKNSLRR
jgi:hypothetical protein